MTPLRRMLPFLALLAGAAPLAPACAQDDFAADAERLVTALQLQDGSTVADIGAGNGELAVALARKVGPMGKVFATELEEARLRDIREAAESAGLANLSAVEAHPTRTNLPDRCCDALVMRKVYHHIDDPRQMNASLRQSLKPGGLLAILDFDPDSTESSDPSRRDTGEQHGVTSATVARELADAGFEVVTVEDGERAGRFMVLVRRPSE
jgi:ubiquinone/menaquinone biosynthesis C-methylase UbiE